MAQGRDCNQPYRRRELTTGLPCRQQVLGRSCCKHQWSALENTSRLPCATLCTANPSPGISEREVQKGGTGREKRQLYQHLTCTSGDSSTTSLRGAGQGIALSIGLRTALERPLRTAKPDPRGWPVQCEIKTPNCKFDI